MRIGRIGMTVVMIMMVVVMMMPVTVVMRSLTACGLLHDGAETFDMVVMAFLNRADIVLEAKDLRAIFAHLAVHGRLTS